MHIYQQVRKLFTQLNHILPKNENINFGAGRVETKTFCVEKDLTLYNDLVLKKNLQDIIN